MRALEQADSFRDAVAAASVDAEFSLVEGLDAPLLAALLERRRSAGRPGVVLVVTPTGRRADALGPALGALLPGAEVLHFPAGRLFRTSG
jgi:transcription-repair coupling factor